MIKTKYGFGYLMIFKKYQGLLITLFCGCSRVQYHKNKLHHEVFEALPSSKVLLL
jgi:hypothetical protein